MCNYHDTWGCDSMCVFSFAKEYIKRSPDFSIEPPTERCYKRRDTLVQVIGRFQRSKDREIGIPL